VGGIQQKVSTMGLHLRFYIYIVYFMGHIWVGLRLGFQLVLGAGKTTIVAINWQLHGFVYRENTIISSIF
jgi:hypothetical protein